MPNEQEILLNTLVTQFKLDPVSVKAVIEGVRETQAKQAEIVKQQDELLQAGLRASADIAHQRELQNLDQIEAATKSHYQRRLESLKDNAEATKELERKMQADLDDIRRHREQIQEGEGSDPLGLHRAEAALGRIKGAIENILPGIGLGFLGGVASTAGLAANLNAAVNRMREMEAMGREIAFGAGQGGSGFAPAFAGQLQTLRDMSGRSPEELTRLASQFTPVAPPGAAGGTMVGLLTQQALGMGAGFGVNENSVARVMVKLMQLDEIPIDRVSERFTNLANKLLEFGLPVSEGLQYLEGLTEMTKRYGRGLEDNIRYVGLFSRELQQGIVTIQDLYRLQFGASQAPEGTRAFVLQQVLERGLVEGPAKEKLEKVSGNAMALEFTGREILETGGPQARELTAAIAKLARQMAEETAGEATQQATGARQETPPAQQEARTPARLVQEIAQALGTEGGQPRPDDARALLQELHTLMSERHEAVPKNLERVIEELSGAVAKLEPGPAPSVEPPPDDVTRRYQELERLQGEKPTAPPPPPPTLPEPRATTPPQPSVEMHEPPGPVTPTVVETPGTGELPTPTPGHAVGHDLPPPPPEDLTRLVHETEEAARHEQPSTIGGTPPSTQGTALPAPIQPATQPTAAPAIPPDADMRRITELVGQLGTLVGKEAPAHGTERQGAVPGESRGGDAAATTEAVGRDIYGKFLEEFGIVAQGTTIKTAEALGEAAEGQKEATKGFLRATVKYENSAQAVATGMASIQDAMGVIQRAQISMQQGFEDMVDLWRSAFGTKEQKEMTHERRMSQARAFVETFRAMDIKDLPPEQRSQMENMMGEALIRFPEFEDVLKEEGIQMPRVDPDVIRRRVQQRMQKEGSDIGGRPGIGWFREEQTREQVHILIQNMSDATVRPVPDSTGGTPNAYEEKVHGGRR